MAQREEQANGRWWRGGVFYQIYPRSFRDLNGDGIGDLAGVASHLDHVARLGADGVWLSPFFQSPQRDFGYDVSDYRAVDPQFGTLEDFDRLLDAAHARGLKVIIDQVYSHTSSNHPWFQESRQDAENPRADWYVWADPKPDGSPPNNWQAYFGGAAWSWEPRRSQYYLHNFLPSQPDLNFRAPGVRAAIMDVARFWLERGVDGFRLDVANYYVHDALLRDNPPRAAVRPALPLHMQTHVYNSNQPETFDVVRELRLIADGYGDRMLLGELAPGSYELMHAFTQGQDRLHTAYSFDFLGPWPGATRMLDILSRWGEGPDDGWPSWAFSNHDVIRVASRWSAGQGRNARQAGRAALALLLALRGTIFLYQGEELGLPEADVPFEALQDPAGKAGWPAYKGRDGCRTPFPWTDTGATAGFSSSGKSWLPFEPAHAALAASLQEADPGSQLSLCRTLLERRRTMPALRDGGFTPLAATDDALAFLRQADGEAVLCAANIGPSAAALDLPEGDWRPLLAEAAVLDGRRIALDPFGWGWFRRS